MRQKDAELVGEILGNELRTCMAQEHDGLWAAVNALSGYMSKRYASDFNVAAYDAAVSRGMSPFAGPGFSRLKDGRTMCSICFAYRTKDELFTDGNGETWDVCAGDCAEQAGAI